jgi:hypothetical protein
VNAIEERKEYWVDPPEEEEDEEEEGVQPIPRRQVELVEPTQVCFNRYPRALVLN